MNKIMTISALLIFSMNAFAYKDCTDENGFNVECRAPERTIGDRFSDMADDLSDYGNSLFESKPEEYDGCKHNDCDSNGSHTLVDPKDW
jgi:hypothetical protein